MVANIEYLSWASCLKRGVVENVLICIVSRRGESKFVKPLKKNIARIGFFWRNFSKIETKLGSTVNNIIFFLLHPLQNPTKHHIGLSVHLKSYSH